MFTLTDALMKNLSPALVSPITNMNGDSFTDEEQYKTLVERYLTEKRIAREFQISKSNIDNMITKDDDLNQPDSEEIDTFDEADRRFMERQLKQPINSKKSDKLHRKSLPSSVAYAAKSDKLQRKSLPSPVAYAAISSASRVADSNEWRATGNASERQERIEKLSIPIADKFIPLPQPPKLSTDCPNLSVIGIENLQASDTFIDHNFVGDEKKNSTVDEEEDGKRESMDDLVYLPPSAKSIRMTITADVDSQWRQSHKRDIQSYGRCDLCLSGSIRDSKPLIQPAALKRHIFQQTTGDITGTGIGSLLSKGLKGTSFKGRKNSSEPPRNALAEMRSFITSFKLDFICLVIDMHMQIIGTYDVSLGKYITGLDIGPAFLSKKDTGSSSSSGSNFKKQGSSKLETHANLFELDLENLPENVFAVVPIILDDSNMSRNELVNESRIKSKTFQDLNFRTDLYCLAHPPEKNVNEMTRMFESEEDEKSALKVRVRDRLQI
jgi:hypothetical protein